MEGSFSAVDGRIYVGTEQGDLFCLEMSRRFDNLERPNRRGFRFHSGSIKRAGFQRSRRRCTFIACGNRTVSWFGSSRRKGDLAESTRSGVGSGRAQSWLMAVNYRVKQWLRLLLEG